MDGRIEGWRTPSSSWAGHSRAGVRVLASLARRGGLVGTRETPKQKRGDPRVCVVVGVTLALGGGGGVAVLVRGRGRGVRRGLRRAAAAVVGWLTGRTRYR
jgi:hypothetical protein